ncbi:MAG: flagellar biosynthesis protein FlhF, partial [Planctomycetes bacterium]|nr:flagellar biosynthesis protein FlhF [Planctomycetota bacterium]
MTIKTFRAHSVSDALAQIKKELGAGAVILHTRTYKVGGVLGVGAKSITEITATADMAVTSRLSARQPAAARPVPAPPAKTPVRPAH